MRHLAVVTIAMAAFAGACAAGTEGPGSGAGSDSPAGSGGRSSDGGGSPGHGGSGDGGVSEGSTAASAPTSTATGSASTTGASTGTATTASAGVTTSTAASTAASTGSGGGLDPELELPAAGGTPCEQVGSGTECPGIEVCRIASESGGICESCGSCGNLNAPCTASDQCDILFQCFQGHCQNLCPLGSSYCGAPEDCIDVGHDTYGVCAPF